jgi:hypothetical protein
MEENFDIFYSQSEAKKRCARLNGGIFNGEVRAERE